MYTTGYSQVSKSSPRAQKKTQYRSKGKSCGYYMRIVFFFSSLIQSLIIVSLVLFLVYGKTQDSASTSRIQDLEESFSRLSIENMELRQQRKNLTNLLNTTLTEKARNDWDLAKLRYLSNISSIFIQDMDKKLQQAYNKLIICETKVGSGGPCLTTFPCNCGLITERMKAGLALVESNFTQTVQMMRMEMDQTAKERDTINLEVISLRRDKSTHEKEVEFFKQKCKDDFFQSLSGISNVSKAFLEKINSLFPSHIAFQLTCDKQRDHLEQIRTNCTSLSMEVEDKLQRYLNVVGEQVSTIQAENSRMKAENWRLSDDYRSCSVNYKGLVKQHKQNIDKLQGKHDEEKEKLLMDKMRLNGEIEVLNNNVRYKSKANDHLTEQIKQLNMSCIPKPGFGGFVGGSTGTQSQPGLGLGGTRFTSSSSSGGNQLYSAGAGSSSGSAYNNKPVSTGTGSSSSSIGSGSSSGSAYNNRPVSTGTGSSSSSIGSGSSSGSAYNKQGSTGTGSSSSSIGSGSSSGSAYNKQGSTGTGSSSSSIGSGSSSGSAYNRQGSTGTGSSSGSAYNKQGSTGTGSSTSTGLKQPVSSGKSSSGIGSSSAGSTGSTNKSGSTNLFSWYGANSGQSKTGSETGRGPSTGNSGGTGSSFDAGRSSGSISVAQHIKDLQLIINPPGPEDKQDLSRILG